MSSCCGGCGSSVFRLQVEWTRPSCPALSAALPEDLLHQTWSGVKHGPGTQMSQLESVANKENQRPLTVLIMCFILFSLPTRSVSLYSTQLLLATNVQIKNFSMTEAWQRSILDSWSSCVDVQSFVNKVSNLNLRTYNDPSLPRIRD